MSSILINLEYDGSNYHGWIKQKNIITIQSSLEKAIRTVTKSKNFKTFGASKTDSGVHAIAQKVVIKIDFTPKLSTFIKAINKALPNDIYISKGDFVSDDFSFNNVKQKSYIYTINDRKWSMFDSRYSLFWDKGEIDVKNLQKILNLFIGFHDFKLFSGLSRTEILENRINIRRTIDDIKVFRENDFVKIKFTSKGFITYQIRYIVQVSLSCYLNKITTWKIEEMLNGEGTKLPYKANSCGLMLVDIELNTNN